MFFGKGKSKRKEGKGKGRELVNGPFWETWILSKERASLNALVQQEICYLHNFYMARNMLLKKILKISILLCKIVTFLTIMPLITFSKIYQT
jgi:hypothetical protein